MTSKISGKRVREVRARFNLSIIGWSRLLGISPSTAYRWEERGVKTIEDFQHSLIELFAGLPKQDLKNEGETGDELKLLWRLLGQVYGGKK